MAKSFLAEYSRKVKQLQNDRNSCSSIGDIGNNSKQGRKLVFSSPISKLRLSSAVRILSTVDLANLNSDFSHSNVAYSNKSIASPGFAFDWNPVRNNFQWEARWKRLRAVLS